MSRIRVALLALSAAVVAVLPAAAGAQDADAVVVGHDMPTWSPDGSKIAFVGFRSGRVGDIYTTNPNGKNLRRLTRTTAHEDMPRWSPDGSQIAFVRHAGGAAIDFHIFVMNADGSNVRQVTTTGAPNFAPTWSPDGSKLAFVSTGGTTGFSSNADIYVINVDGTGRTRLTTHPGRDDSPHWSPNADLIAFESNRSPSATIRLYVMRADGSDVRPLTKHPVEWHNEMKPAWSPDGTKVAYVTERHPPLNNGEIYVVDAATGENNRRVTRNSVRDDTPAWSPDGSRFVVSRGASLRPELYVLRSEGGGARKITGVNLRFVRLNRFEPRPTAGRYYTVELVVRPRIDRFADVACYAAIGRNILDVEFAGVRSGKLRCAWFVPRRSKGKQFYGFAGVRAGGTQVTRSFSLRIR